MTIESQNQKILSHLLKGNGISQRLAAKIFDCFRLSARIKNLRDSGNEIYCVMVKHGKKYHGLYYMENSNHFEVYGKKFV